MLSPARHHSSPGRVTLFASAARVPALSGPTREGPDACAPGPEFAQFAGCVYSSTAVILKTRGFLGSGSTPRTPPDVQGRRCCPPLRTPLVALVASAAYAGGQRSRRGRLAGGVSDPAVDIESRLTCGNTAHRCIILGAGRIRRDACGWFGCSRYRDSKGPRRRAQDGRPLRASPPSGQWSTKKVLKGSVLDAARSCFRR